MASTNSILPPPFGTIEIATNVATALRRSAKVPPLVKMINRVARQAKTREIRTRYGRIPGFTPMPVCVQKEDIFGLRIFTFIDDGFYSLLRDRRIEASLVFRGREISRDGSIV